MSLSRSTLRTMDLAAFPLGDVVEVRDGVFRHRRAGLFGLFGGRPSAGIHRAPKAPTAPRPEPDTDHFVWRRPDEPFPPILEISQ